jgi:hypothetical protein
METLSVRCNHCGAPLEVAGNIRFVTCQFCQSSLEVKRHSGAVFTEEVARIAENTEKIAEGLDVIQLQNDLEKLDRDWEARPARPLITWDRKGVRRKSNPMMSLWIAVFLMIFAFTASVFFEGIISAGLIRVVIMAMGIMAAISFILLYARHQQERTSREAYQRRRRELERRLEELKQK